MKSFSTVLMLVMSVSVFAPSASAEHEGDIWIGASANAQLKHASAGFAPTESQVLLTPSGGLLQGWTSNNPGFDDIEQDLPGDDTYVLEPGAQIWLEVVYLDPALLAWTPSFQPIDEIGERAFLGSSSSEIHTHLIWHVNSDAPEFDPDRVHWQATFRLVDTGSTAYGDSEDFTLTFAIHECIVGDTNQDGSINNFDIDPFVEILVAPENAEPQLRCAADTNLDGYVNNFDIDAFVDLLTRN